MTVEKLRTKLLVSILDHADSSVLELRDRPQVWRWRKGENAIAEDTFAKMWRRTKDSSALGGPTVADEIKELFYVGPNGTPLWLAVGLKPFAYEKLTPDFTNDENFRRQLRERAFPRRTDEDSVPHDFKGTPLKETDRFYKLCFYSAALRSELDSRSDIFPSSSLFTLELADLPGLLDRLIESTFEIAFSSSRWSVLDYRDVLSAIANATSNPQQSFARISENLAEPLTLAMIADIESQHHEVQSALAHLLEGTTPD